MKVLAVSASPRKGGNSDVLCDRFLQGAAEAGHEVEKIRLAEKSIRPCVACYACRKASVCVQKDDMAEIQQKLIDADVIVLATPVYFYSMDAQMKIMIDRCLARYREITNKEFYFIVTAAAPEHEAADATLAGLRGYLRCLPGAQEKGVIYGMGAWDKGDIYRHPALDNAYEAGKNV
jgi:multimeric flavodoxin WrbA